MMVAAYGTPWMIFSSGTRSITASGVVTGSFAD
jgi:hypothetical protein